MRKNLEQLMILLAGSGLSKREIIDVLRELRKMPPELIADQILMLRTDVRHAANARFSRPYGGSADISVRNKRDDIPTRIEDMLRHEAKLTVRQAAAELVHSLKNKNPQSTEAIQPPNRESFVRWIEKLNRTISASELLHHATIIRNRYIHHGDQDWPLRK